MKYYKNIDELPIYNFNKILDTGNLQYLVKEGKVNELGNIIWDEIIDQFTEYVGFTQSYKDYMAFSKKAALLICQAYLEDKKYLLTFAKIAQNQADEHLSDEKQDFDKSVAHISKYMGYRIDTRKTSVKEFYSIIKLMNDGKQENTK